MNSRAEPFRSNPLRLNAIVIALALAGALILTKWIISDNVRALILAGVFVVGSLSFLAILQDWRRGLYLFLIWMVFEDLIRKFAGNATVMFFVKDVIAAMM